jgi:pyruvate kinase
MICKANLAGKPIIVAAQMLETMVNNPRWVGPSMPDVKAAFADVWVKC